jgi:hypothetical protein
MPKRDNNHAFCRHCKRGSHDILNEAGQVAATTAGVAGHSRGVNTKSSRPVLRKRGKPVFFQRPRLSAHPAAGITPSAAWLLATPACVDAVLICCHAVDQIHCRSRRQHKAAGRITAAGDRRIGLNLIKAGDREFNAKRLAVEDERAHRAGDGLRDIRKLDVADRRRLPLRVRSGSALCGGRVASLLSSGRLLGRGAALSHLRQTVN